MALTGYRTYTRTEQNWQENALNGLQRNYRKAEKQMDELLNASVDATRNEENRAECAAKAEEYRSLVLPRLAECIDRKAAEVAKV